MRGALLGVLVVSLACPALGVGCARAGAARDAGTGGTRPSDGAWSDAARPDAMPSFDASLRDGAVIPPDSRAMEAGLADSGVRSSRCGDGFIDPPEICDDGDTESGDGCSGNCLDIECSGSDRYEDPTTHRCFWRDTTVASRSSAISTCMAGGGTLAQWASVDERDGAYRATVEPRGGRVWIGLTRVGETWTWDDGTASTTFAVDFRSGEPNGDGPCAEWGPRNSLNDIPCSERRDTVCVRAPAGMRR